MQNLRENDLFNSSFNAAIHIHDELLWQTSRNTRGRILQRLLPDRLVLAMMGMQFPRNHKLFEVFDKKLQQLFVSGLIDFEAKECLFWLKPDSYRKHRHEFENDDPKVLTFDDLEAGFVIWATSILISIFVFLIEWLTNIREFWRLLSFESFKIRSCFKKRLTKSQKKSRKIRSKVIMVQEKQKVESF